MHGRDEHAVGLEAHHLPRRQVHDGHECLAHEVLGLIPLVDAREYLPVLARAVVQDELEQPVGFLHGLAALDLDDAEVALEEGVEIHCLLQLRLYLQRRQGGLAGLLLELLQLGQLLVQVYAREERVALLHGDVSGQAAPDGGAVPIPDGLVRAYLLEGLRAAAGHEGREQAGADAQALEQVIHDRRQPRLFPLVLRQHPGRVLVDILVSPRDDPEHLLQRRLRLEGVHELLVLLAQAGGHADKLRVLRRGLALRRQRAVKVLEHHGDGAGEQVAVVVGEVGVYAGDEQLVREVAVRAERELAHQEVAQRVHAVALRQDDGIDDVALGLGHLAAAQQQPAVAEDLLRQGLAHAHEHRRPDDGVEADYLLADHMHVGGPVFLLAVAALVHVAEGGQVVEQRVHPHVHHVSRVKVHGHAPGEARARDAQVLETGVDEVLYHLIDAAGRLEEGSGEQQLAHPVRVLRQAEEIGFLLGVFHLAPAVGALAVHELALGPEALAGRAVHARVLALVYVAVVVHLLENALDALDVVVVGRPDEAVVRDVHELPEVEDTALALHDIVHELLRRHARGLRLFLYLLAVLVRAREEHHVVAAHPLITRYGVRRDGAVGVPDVQLVGRIIDRCGDVECAFLAHWRFPRSSMTQFVKKTLCHNKL